MNRRRIGAAAVLVAIAGAWLITTRTKPHRVLSPVPNAPTVATAPTAAGGPLLPRPAPALPPVPDYESTPEAHAVPAAEQAQLARVRNAMVAAARPCWLAHQARPAAPDRPDETIEHLDVEYRLRVRGGRTTIEDVVPYESTIADDTLSECILDRIAQVRLPDGGAPRAGAVRERISLGDLTVPMPPPGVLETAPPTR